MRATQIGPQAIGSVGSGFGETGLKVTNNRAELARCEEAGPKRPRRVLADWRQSSQRTPHLYGHVGELPADLVVDDLRPVGGRQTGRFDGIRGGAKCVRAHVTDGDGLTGGSGSGGGGPLHLVRRHPTGEAASNLLCRGQLSSGERPSASDGSARTIVSWSVRLEQP